MAEDSRTAAPVREARVLASHFADVLDQAPMGIVAYDLDFRILDFNETFARFTERYNGVPATTVRIGITLDDLVPGSIEEIGGLVAPVLEGQTVTVREMEIEGPGGISFWDLHFAPLSDDGAVTGILQISIDATERVEAHRTLEVRVAERTAELERRRQVADGLHFILRILNSCCPGDQVLDYIISEASRLLDSDAVAVYRVDIEGGYLLMQTAYGLADDRVRDLIIPVMSSAGIVAETIVKRKPMVVPDATVLLKSAQVAMPPDQLELLKSVIARYPALLAAPIVVGDDLYGALTMYYPEPRTFSDDDVALATELADHLALALENSALRDLAEVSAASAERNRLARDLHDAVTQTLFSASLIAEVLPAIWERDAEEGRKRLEELRLLSRGALAEMRTLLVELRPSAIIEANFADLMQQLAEVASATGVDVDIDCERSPVPLPAEVQMAFYRIAQEAINNVMRHSKATHVAITCRRPDDGAVLSIADDGLGFDPGVERGPQHIGQHAMAERAADVGATLTVESAVGDGTTVLVEWHAGGGCSC